MDASLCGRVFLSARVSLATRMSLRFILGCALLLTLPGCVIPIFLRAKQNRIETHSLDGVPLARPTLPRDVRMERERNLEIALKSAEVFPSNLDSFIWVGRRTAYLGRYHEAIGIYTDALVYHPDSAEILRHRGHRYISVRRFGQAIIDLSRAAELIEGLEDVVEQDGLPNARGVPTSTLHTNIYYHLGLAYYLTGQFDLAAETFTRCRAKSKNPDMLVATLNWECAALARAGRADETTALLADVDSEWDVIENHAYHQLLLLYRGEVDRDTLLEAARSDGEDESMPQLNFASTAYGVANHALITGDLMLAQAVLREICATDAWPSFGAIAAEVELHRQPEWRHAPEPEPEMDSDEGDSEDDDTEHGDSDDDAKTTRVVPTSLEALSA